MGKSGVFQPTDFTSAVNSNDSISASTSATFDSIMDGYLDFEEEEEEEEVIIVAISDGRIKVPAKIVKKVWPTYLPGLIMHNPSIKINNNSYDKKVKIHPDGRISLAIPNMKYLINEAFNRY